MLYLRPDNKKPQPPDWPTLFAKQVATARHPLLQEYYQAGVASGETPIAEIPLVALDIETTGLNPKHDAIVSIGLVPFDLRRIQTSRSRYWVVNPQKPLKTQSIVVHGITHSEIASSPVFGAVVPELLKNLTGMIVVVHCRQIERQFFAMALQQLWQEGIIFPVIDTMELEARQVRRGFKDRIAQLFGRNRRSIRLASSRERYQLPVYRPHHALIDALATAELLQAQIAHHYDAQTPVREFWL